MPGSYELHFADLADQSMDEAKGRGLVGEEAEREILRFLILHQRDDE